MKRRPGWRYICGGAVMAAAAALVLVVFSLLSVTDKQDLYLSDSQDVRYGWRYEVLVSGEVQDYEPRFEDNGYTLVLPEGTEAVRITRTMEEDVPRAQLEWMRYGDGVEVFLDGEVLHTDFPQLDRDADGFVHPEQDQWQRLIPGPDSVWGQTRMSLPADYLGKELSVITYFPPDGGSMAPEYPFLGNEDSAVAVAVVFSVRYDVVMTVYALLALLMAGVFLLDSSNSNADGSMLLLCLYFLMLFLNTAYGTYEGYYSVLTERMDLRFLRAVYMAPLYLYLAMRMRARLKWPLCGCVLAWAVYEGVREFLRIRIDGEAAYAIGPGALVVFLAVTAALCADGLRRKQSRTPQEKKWLVRYGVMAAAVAVVYLLGRARAWDGLGDYLARGIWTAVRMGNYGPLVTMITDISSYTTVIVVVSEVIRRTIQTRRTVDVLQERSRQTMAGYERMLSSEDGTRALHHEMRHHMTALSAILADGDVERARRYVDAVADDMEKLPTGRYCQNILVDMIAGSFLDRAKADQIRVEHHLNVPPELNIADEDLSVFLSNMLQNALEACQRMESAEERYIWVDMHLRGNFLCVQCVNSVRRGEEDRERPGHGYGLAAMRAVAEKYNSVLLVERTPGEFSVLSDLCLEAL